MAEINPYQILGIPEDAPIEEIAAQYRKLAMNTTQIRVVVQRPSKLSVSP